MSFIYDLGDTRWNDIGVTFNGFMMDFTNGLGGAPVGAAASRFMNLKNNGTSVYSIDKNGSIYAAGDLTLSGTDRAGLIAKSLTTAQRDAIVSPVNGSVIYNTTTSFLNAYTGGAWGAVGGSLTIGTTPITSGTTTRFLYDLAGVVSETAGLTYTAATPSVNVSAHVYFPIDNTYDIGGNGATRPRNVYASGAINAGYSGGAGTVNVLNSGGVTTTQMAGGTGVLLSSGGSLSWDANATLSGSGDTILARDAANTLALRNGTSGQAFNVYDAYTDGSNYRRVTLGNAGGGGAVLRLEGAGTGANGTLSISSIAGATSDIKFSAGSNGYCWQMNGSGHFLATTDNTYDIGASGATRPRSIYAGTSAIIGATSQSLINDTGFQAGSAGYFYWSGKSTITSPSDGVIRLTDTAETSFNRVQFGGTTVAFPALSRTNNGIQFKRADDSTGTWYKSTVVTLATLSASISTAASAGSGALAFITDITTATNVKGVTAAGGGTTPAAVYSDGTQWKAM